MYNNYDVAAAAAADDDDGGNDDAVNDVLGDVRIP